MTAQSFQRLVRYGYDILKYASFTEKSLHLTLFFVCTLIEVHPKTLSLHLESLSVFRDSLQPPWEVISHYNHYN